MLPVLEKGNINTTKDIISIGDRFEGNNARLYIVLEIIKNCYGKNENTYRLLCNGTSYNASEEVLKECFKRIT